MRPKSAPGLVRENYVVTVSLRRRLVTDPFVAHIQTWFTLRNETDAAQRYEPMISIGPGARAILFVGSSEQTPSRSSVGMIGPAFDLRPGCAVSVAWAWNAGSIALPFRQMFRLNGTTRGLNVRVVAPSHLRAFGEQWTRRELPPGYVFAVGARRAHESIRERKARSNEQESS